MAIAGERWTIGLSTNGAAIEAVSIDDRSGSSPTVLLVGGLHQPDESSDAVSRVCESTCTRGLTADEYLRRAAILGRDDRGGGMAMFLATELAGL